VAGVLESSATLGAAVGLLIASQSASHSTKTGAAARCPRHESPATCLGHTTSAAVGRLVGGAVAGAIVGLLIGLLLLWIRREVREAARAWRQRPRRTPTATPIRTTIAAPSSRPNPVEIKVGLPTSTTTPSELSSEERRQMRRKVRQAVLKTLQEIGGEGKRHTILAHARQVGGFSQRELMSPSPPAARRDHPLLIDHDLSWALTELKRDGLLENPARNTWRLTAHATVNAEPAGPSVTSLERIEALRAMPYNEYLRSPEWRQTRAAALVRADYCCALDPTHTHELEVHHRTYERLGAELSTDLIVLCRPCHRLHHKANGRPGRAT
jgi:hypothetical protein